MAEIYLSRKSQLYFLILLTGIFFLNMLCRLILGPLLPVLEGQLGISHATSGSLFMFIAFGYAGGLFASAFVSASLSNRRTIVMSAVSTAFAFYLVALSDSLWGIRGGLLLLGLATGLYLPSGMTALTLATRPDNWGKAIAIHEYAPTLAFICAPLLVEAFLGLGGWEGVVALVGTASLVLGLFFFRFAPGTDFKGEPPQVSSISLILKGPAFWIIVVFFALAVGSTVGLFSMMPLYLVEERGIDRTLANSVIGLSRIPLLVIVLISGWLSDRFGPKPMIATVFIFSALTTIVLAIIPDRWVLVIVFIQPLLTVCFFPAGFTIISRITPPAARSLYLSLTMVLANLVASGVIPAILGFFGEFYSFGMGFILLGVTMLLSVLLMPFLKLHEQYDK